MKTESLIIMARSGVNFPYYRHGL